MLAKSHGNQLQLAGRLYIHEESTMFHHFLHDVRHMSWHIGELVVRDRLVGRRAADWNQKWTGKAKT